MQKLLWIGSPFFGPELEACGWEKAFLHNFEDPRILCWDELVKIAGFVPDVVVVADKSRPPFVLGMEEFPCITVFYAVDTHIHSWEPYYAQGFDACLVSLKDDMPKFAGPFLDEGHIWWSPPFAHAGDLPDDSRPKIWDSLFVGSNNPAIMPERASFLHELGKLTPGLKITSGNYRQLFPQARVLVNHAANGDLNFRVFEALGCGGCLVTPRIDHGLADLFIDGEHAVFYAPNDPGDAAYRINFLLAHPDVREHVARTGYEVVNASHRSIHRAQAFTDHLCDLYMEGADALIARRQARAARIREKSLAIPYLLWANETEDDNMRQAYLAAARGVFGLHGLALK